MLDLQALNAAATATCMPHRSSGVAFSLCRSSSARSTRALVLHVAGSIALYQSGGPPQETWASGLRGTSVSSNDMAFPLSGDLRGLIGNSNSVNLSCSGSGSVSGSVSVSRGCASAGCASRLHDIEPVMGFGGCQEAYVRAGVSCSAGKKPC